MKKTVLTLLALMTMSLSFAQSNQADQVLKTLRLANDYFMAKYADPTLPTNVKLSSAYVHHHFGPVPSTMKA